MVSYVLVLTDDEIHLLDNALHSFRIALMKHPNIKNTGQIEALAKHLSDTIVQSNIIADELRAERDGTKPEEA